MEEKERYIILSGRQIKDTQNQSQAFLDIETVCRLLNQQDKHIKELEGKLAESEKKMEEIRDVLNGNDVEIQDNIYLTDFLDTILKKYGGENESK